MTLYGMITSESRASSQLPIVCCLCGERASHYAFERRTRTDQSGDPTADDGPRTSYCRLHFEELEASSERR